MPQAIWLDGVRGSRALNLLKGRCIGFMREEWGRGERSGVREALREMVRHSK